MIKTGCEIFVCLVGVCGLIVIFVNAFFAEDWAEPKEEDSHDGQGRAGGKT
jgi:hypothetical protein